MAVTLRIKRRAAGGAPGAPATLKTSEPAFNEQDRVLYIGFGDDGAGTATSVVAVGGEGAFVTHAGLADALENTGAGDMLKSTYDNNNDGVVDRASTADAVDWDGVQGKPGNPTQSAAGLMPAGDKAKLDGIAANANNYAHPTGDGNQHVPATGTANNGKVLKAGASAGSAAWQSLTKADVGLSSVNDTSDADKPVSTAQQTALNLKAPLNSPGFTGVPTAPTAANATQNTQIATTAFVHALLTELVGAAPAELNTLYEIAAELQGQDSALSTLIAQLATKLTAANNLSDLTDDATARGNLGLGNMATQAASAVAITGGTINNVELDGGTF